MHRGECSVECSRAPAAKRPEIETWQLTEDQVVEAVEAVFLALKASTTSRIKTKRSVVKCR